MRIRPLIIAAAVPLLVAARPLAAQSNPAELFEAALYEQEIRGDLEAAERLYRDILDDFPADRAAAARALVELGSLYELAGDRQAEAVYRRVVTEFADERDAAERARSRLAAIAPISTGLPDPSGIVVRQIWSTEADFDVHSLSPDGSQVAFVDWGRVPAAGLRGNADLAIYDTRTRQARLITNRPPQTQDATYIESPIWSQDGQQLAYVVWDTTWSHQKLRVVGADGSGDRVLVANDQLPNLRPMAWSPDGDFIVTLASGWDDVVRITLVSTTDGSIRTLKTLGTHLPWPLSVSPDGRYIAYDYLEEEGSTRHDVFVLATDGSRETRLLAGPADDDRPFFTPDGGQIVFRSDRSGRQGLWSIRVQEGLGIGEPELVRPEIAPAVTLGFTERGSLYYRIPTRLRDVQTAELNPLPGSMSKPTAVTDRFVGTNSHPAWNPTGQKLAYLSRRGPGGSGPTHLVIRSMASGDETSFQLPFPTRQGDSRPTWSSDGEHLLIEGGPIGATTANPRMLISYAVNAARGEVRREPFARDVVGFAEGVAFFATPAQTRRLRGLGVRLAGHRALEVFGSGDEAQRPGEELLWVRNGVSRVTSAASQSLEALTPQGHMHAWSLSPDGGVLALALPNEPAREVSNVLWLMSVDSRALREGARFADDQEITAIRWTPDSKALLFTVTEAGGDSRVWRLPAAGGEPSPLEIPLEPAQLADLDFHPDGTRVAFTTSRSWNELWVMEGLPWQR